MMQYLFWHTMPLCFQNRKLEIFQAHAFLFAIVGEKCSEQSTYESSYSNSQFDKLSYVFQQNMQLSISHKCLQVHRLTISVHMPAT